MSNAETVIHPLPGMRPSTEADMIGSVDFDVARRLIPKSRVAGAAGDLVLRTGSDLAQEAPIPLYGSYDEAAAAAFDEDGGDPPDGGAPDDYEYDGDEPGDLPRLRRNERTLSSHERELFVDMQMAWIKEEEQLGNVYMFTLPHDAEASIRTYHRIARSNDELISAKFADIRIRVEDAEAPGIAEVGDIQRRFAARIAVELFDQKVKFARMSVKTKNDLLLYDEVFGGNEYVMSYFGESGQLDPQEALRAIQSGETGITAIVAMDLFFVRNPQFTMLSTKKDADNEQFLDYVDLYDIKPEPRLAKRRVSWRGRDVEEIADDGVPNPVSIINKGDILADEIIYGPVDWFMRRSLAYLDDNEGYNFQLAFREHRDDWIRHVRNLGTNQDGYVFLTRVDEEHDGQKSGRRILRLARYNFGPVRKGLAKKINELMNLDENSARRLAGLSREEPNMLGEEDPVLQRLIDRTLEDAATEEDKGELIRQLQETGRGYVATAAVCYRQGIERLRARNMLRTRGLRMIHYLRAEEVAPAELSEEDLLAAWGADDDL